jgi:hypothetical protein
VTLGKFEPAASMTGLAAMGDDAGPCTSVLAVTPGTMLPRTRVNRGLGEGMAGPEAVGVKQLSDGTVVRHRRAVPARVPRAAPLGPTLAPAPEAAPVSETVPDPSVLHRFRD